MLDVSLKWLIALSTHSRSFSSADFGHDEAHPGPHESTNPPLGGVFKSGWMATLHLNNFLYSLFVLMGSFSVHVAQNFIEKLISPDA